MTNKYKISGMTCAACQTHVEKAAGKVPGVISCGVSLMMNTLTVEGDVSPEIIIAAVEKAGYAARLISETTANKGTADVAADETDYETSKKQKRLFISCSLLIFLVYFSMGVTMFGFPVPEVLNNPVSLGLIECFLSAIILWVNGDYFRKGFGALLHRSTNMDTLVAMGSAVSFLYSIVMLFKIAHLVSTGAPGYREEIAGTHLWFESAAMIPTLINVGKTLEAYSKGKTTKSIRNLLKLSPKLATVIRDGKETQVSVDEVRIGDEFIVKSGETIPVDGIILEGAMTVNESMLTGESVPVDKKAGDTVSAATVSLTGFLRCEASRVGENTTFAQIVRLVTEASSGKAPVSRIADKVSAVFVPFVLALAVLTLTGWMLAGRDFAYSLTRAVSVLVISCPCALGLATPVAIMVATGKGAKHGILFKSAAALENLGKTSIIVLDKTGTLTQGVPSVTSIQPDNGLKDNELLAIAAGLEAKSGHPLAKAIMAIATEREIVPVATTAFENLPGKGIKCCYEHGMLFGGNKAFIAETAEIPSDVLASVDKLASEGNTVLLFASSERYLGLIAVADSLREDSADAVTQLRDMGLKTVMLTGDQRLTAQKIGREAGIEEIQSDVKPDEKESTIRQLQVSGTVCMVGDGINDAPALARADIGVAIGAGTDVAMDAADVVLSKSSLTDLAAAVRLSKTTIRIIHQNLFWAFFYNLICIPLAMGVYQLVFPGLPDMKPAAGALAMSLSSITVCLNSLRLNKANLFKTRKNALTSKELIQQRKTKGNQQYDKEEMPMEKTMKIEGMMCCHCEARVKKTLEALEGVQLAVVSHESGTAVVTLSAEVADETLKAAIEAQDYRVLSVQ